MRDHIGGNLIGDEGELGGGGIELEGSKCTFFSLLDTAPRALDRERM